MDGRWLAGPTALGAGAGEDRLLGAAPGVRFFLRALEALQPQDQFEVRLEFGFKSDAPQGAAAESVLLLQLARHPALLERSTDSTLFVLNGLSVVAYQPPEGKAHITYRFFASAVPLRPSAGALAALFGARGSEEHCDLADLFALSGLRVVAALPDRLRIEYRAAGEWAPCVEVAAPMRYFPPAEPLHIDLQAVSGAASGKVFALERLSVLEPAHPLDLSAGLLVSHGLVEEIFDKVAHFGERLSRDGKKELVRVGKALAALDAKTARLEVYAADLVRGTAQFQAALLASLAAQKGVSLADIPQMKRIRAVVERLEEVQGRIFRRLQDVRSATRARKVLQDAGAGLQKAAGRLEELQRLTGDARFAALASESTALIDVLAKLDVEALVGELRQLESKAAGTHTRAGIAAALGMCGLVLAFAFAFMRRVHLAEKLLSL